MIDHRCFCGDIVPVAELLGHTRRLHPDHHQAAVEALAAVERIDTAIAEYWLSAPRPAGTLVLCSAPWCTNKTFSWLGVCGTCRVTPRRPHVREELEKSWRRNVGTYKAQIRATAPIKPFLVAAIEAQRPAVVEQLHTELDRITPREQPQISLAPHTAEPERGQPGWLPRFLRRVAFWSAR